jgi:hypothetical protein
MKRHSTRKTGEGVDVYAEREGWGGGGRCGPYMESSITATYRSNSSDVEAHSSTSDEINLFPFFASPESELAGLQTPLLPALALTFTCYNLTRRTSTHTDARASNPPPARAHTQAHVYAYAYGYAMGATAVHTVLLLRAHLAKPMKSVCGVYCQWYSMPCPFTPKAATTT